MPKVANILFDLGNVLIPINWNRPLEILKPKLRFETAQSVANDPRNLRALFLEPTIELETGRWDFFQFYECMCSKLGISMPIEEFRHIWCSIFTPDYAMIDLATKISMKLDTWLVSNTSKVHYDFIVTSFPRVTFFKDSALSYDLGVMKPHPEYYEKAITKFRIAPDESVFIDDLPENVEAAREFGMIGIVYLGINDLVRSLERLGVGI
jgi:putative hydrolase of the HAD superfamily